MPASTARVASSRAGRPAARVHSASEPPPRRPAWHHQGASDRRRHRQAPAPLALLGSGPYASALPAAQLQVLAYMSVDLSGIGYSVHTVFFGFDILCMAYLVLRSRFVPRAIGLLLAIDGLAYLVYSFANLVAPGFAAQLVPWIQMPALIGEGSLCLWLLVVGLDVEQWKERASAATRVWSAPGEALA